MPYVCLRRILRRGEEGNGNGGRREAAADSALDVSFEAASECLVPRTARTSVEGVCFEKVSFEPQTDLAQTQNEKHEKTMKKSVWQSRLSLSSSE